MDDLKTKEKKKSKNLKKCFKCNKKLPVIPFSCKCENFFCSKCRMPEDHECKYNWKKDYQIKLEKENPKIEAKKVDKC